MPDSGRLVLLAPAKVNLYLSVGAVRPDGYHPLTSVFQAIDLCDRILMEPAERLSVTCDPDIGLDVEQNTAYRAAAEYAALVGREPNAAISIEKRIPHGAGLGGGSTDAAAVITGLARWWGLDPQGEQALRAARSVGADVAFFLYGGAAVFDGRGDRYVRRLPPIEATLVLVNPGVVVPTGDVYRVFDESGARATSALAALADALRFRDATGLGAALVNDLESAAIAVEPQVGVCRDWLDARPGSVGVLVAGSGASSFGVFPDEADARATRDAARERGWWAEAVAPSDVGVIEEV